MKILLIILTLLVVSNLTAFIETKCSGRNEGFSPEEWRDYAIDYVENIIIQRDEYVLEVLYEEWEEGVWVYDMKDVYSYNENGYPVQLMMYVWEDGSWQNWMKMTMTNDNVGLPHETLIEIWEPTSEAWVEMLMIFYSYDGNDNISEIISQMFFGVDWENSSRITYTYNNYNNMTYEFNELWNFGGGWVNNSQTTYSYSGQFLTEELEESWEEDTVWENSKLITYVEVGNDHPAERLLQTWDGGGYWVNTRHSDYTYDGEWHEIEDYEQAWEGAWENFQTHYYTYDGDNFLQRLTKDWEPDRAWINHSRYTVEYGNLQADEYEIPEPADFNLSNYPNPFNPTTEIRFQVSDLRAPESAVIEIYNLKGQRIREFRVASSPTLQLVRWNGTDHSGKPVSSGIYFYKLKVGNRELTRKMVLMK